MGKLIKIKSNEGEILTGEVFQDDIQQAELYQPEGFHHIPEPGTDGILIYIGKGESHGIVLGPKKREALEDNAGNTIIYSVSGGTIKAKIILDTDGNIVKDAPGTIKLGVSAGEALIKGTTYVGGETTFLTGLGVLITALKTYVLAIQPIADPPGTVTTTFVTALDAFFTPGVPPSGVLGSFIQFLNSVLSLKTFTE